MAKGDEYSIIPANAQPSNPDRGLRPEDVYLDTPNSHYKLFKIWIPIILIILTILLASYFGYLFWKNDLIVLEERNLIAGEEIDLVEGQSINLNFETHSASFKVVSGQNKFTVIKSPDGKEVIIPVEEEKVFDTNGDGSYDLGIKYIIKSDSKPGLIFRKITQEQAEIIIKKTEISNNKGSQSLGSIALIDEIARGEKSCGQLGGFVCDGEFDYCPTLNQSVLGETCCFGTCYDTQKKCSDLGGEDVEESIQCDGTFLTLVSSSSGVPTNCCIKNIGRPTSDACLQMTCERGTICGVDQSSGVLSCIPKTCTDYGEPECDVNYYCGGSIKYFGDPSNPMTLGCCLTKCITKDQICEDIKMNDCSTNEICSGDNATLIDFGGSQFKCCKECIVDESDDDTETECAQSSDCKADYYTSTFCKDNNVYKTLHDYSCSALNKCVDTTSDVLIEDCQYTCTDGACSSEEEEEPECTADSDCTKDYYSTLFCNLGNVYKTFHDFSCSITKDCKETISNLLVNSCQYGCSNGACLADYHEPECIVDRNCTADYYSNPFCKSDGVYKTLHDYYCSDSGNCEEETSDKLIEECPNGCENAECNSNNGGDSNIPECSDGIDNDGDGKIDALDTTNTAKSGRWFSVWNVNCDSFCSEKGLKFEHNSNGDSCASGETRVKEAVDALGTGIFREGCWPNCEYLIDGMNTIIVSHKKLLQSKKWYCFSESSSRDYDDTDIVAACYCTSELPVCSNGIDDDYDGTIDYSISRSSDVPIDSGCASPEDNSELPHDPQCTSPQTPYE